MACFIYTYRKSTSGYKSSHYALVLSSDAYWGRSGGAKVLGKLSVPGHPTNLDNRRARAYCACSRCGWGLSGLFSLVYLFSCLSPFLGDGLIKTEILFKGPLNPKPTNQPADAYWSFSCK